MKRSDTANTASEENRRLAPLVMAAYGIYRGTVAIPPECVEEARREAAAAAPPAGDRAPAPPGSEQAYVEGLQQEIRERYSLPPGGYETLRARVRDGALGDFTEEDCRAAVRLLDTLLVEALFIESRHGDTPEAVAKLEASIPGLPPRLYRDLLGYYAYINR